MKTESNLAAVKAIPPGKIMFETGQFLLSYPQLRFISQFAERCPLVFDDRQPRITTSHRYIASIVAVAVFPT